MLQKYKKMNRFTRGTGDIACKSSMKIWFYMLALNNTHRENWVLLNSLQYFTEIEAWLLFPTFSYIYAISFHTVYCRRLKNPDV